MANNNFSSHHPHHGAGFATTDFSAWMYAPIVENNQQKNHSSSASFLQPPSHEDYFHRTSKINNNSIHFGDADKDEGDEERHLSGDEDFLDEYDEPYALSWRYLGMFIDCEDEEENDDEVGRQRSRRMSQDDNENGCSRKVLWAAYYDPNYKGGSIGEYQYYNHATEEYDDSYCKSNERCVPLNCHEPEQTDLELVGVFKETDGLEDFAEQLFKHEGYCLWDSDTYEIMNTYREMMPDSCRALYFPDGDGNTIYMDIRPEALGDINIGIYSDDRCTVTTKGTIQDYIVMFYEAEGDEETGQDIAWAWTKAVKRWNKHMSVYKYCQPCRTYDLSRSSGNDYGDYRVLRILENDGEGDSEQWGYDCYDDAGYTNCNQCYKFQSQTDMESATESDLIAATQQGSILEIVVDEVKYGGKRPPLVPKWVVVLLSVVASLVGSCFLLFFCTAVARRWRFCRGGRCRCSLNGCCNSLSNCLENMCCMRRDLPSTFKERFRVDEDGDSTVTHDEDDESCDESKIPLSRSAR